MPTARPDPRALRAGPTRTTQPCAGWPRRVGGRRSAERTRLPPSCATTRRQSAGRRTIRGYVRTRFARRTAASLQGSPSRRSRQEAGAWRARGAISCAGAPAGHRRGSPCVARRSICENRRTRSRPSDVTPCWAPMLAGDRVRMDAESGEGLRDVTEVPVERHAHPQLEIAEGPFLLSESTCLDDRLRSIHDRRETEPPGRDHQALKSEIASLDLHRRAGCHRSSRSG